MVSHLFFYHLVLVALVWLFLLLQLAGPRTTSVSPQRSVGLEPITPKRKRAAAPKPFAGLTQTPPCPLCESECDAVMAPPPRRPAPMAPTTRRPRVIDTSQHCCPHEGWDYRGWLGHGTLRATGHPSGGPWRQLQCLGCHGYLLETHGTIFHGKRISSERIGRVIACLAEGLGIRATARVFAVDPHTVLQWVVQAAEQLRAFSAYQTSAEDHGRKAVGECQKIRASLPLKCHGRKPVGIYFLCDLHVKPGPLDEWSAVLRAVQDGAISAAKASKRWSRSPHWVWGAIDPVTQRWLTMAVGERTWARAQCGVHPVAWGWAPACVPLFLTDGDTDDATVLLAPFGHWIQPEGRQGKGPRPNPRWMPWPELLYAQVVNTRRRRRLVCVRPRGVCGPLDAVQQVLSACGWQSNPSCVERLHRSIRQHVAAVGRRVRTLCKGEDG